MNADMITGVHTVLDGTTVMLTVGKEMEMVETAMGEVAMVGTSRAIMANPPQQNLTNLTNMTKQITRNSMLIVRMVVHKFCLYFQFMKKFLYS